MTEPRDHADDPAGESPGDAAGRRPPLLSVRELRVHFPVRTGLLQRAGEPFRAVDGVSFDLPPGKTLGLVGESGSGKTTVGRAILGLVRTTSGRVLFDGREIDQPHIDRTHLHRHWLHRHWLHRHWLDRTKRIRAFRRDMQIVFQDPAGALNPRLSVRSILAEPICVHRLAKPGELDARIASLLDRCGLPASAADRYPHEFSGGQRQRLVIARALATSPRFLVCDEPTSALDVSIQSQIINLLRELQSDLGLTYLFISHDMAVVRHMCDDIAVMHKGKIVEQGPNERVLRNPEHPYTQTLIAAVPTTSARAKTA
ncbi:MAG: ATP-binding cassette domain-containing protein [Planctomycetota bacterium]